MDKYSALKQYFGYDSFRSGQEPLVDGLIAGRDVLGIMPTGAGKSICYQVPALVRTGVTIVISPLISLMKDQVAALKSAGVPAAYLNSSLTPRQMEIATERAMQGQYRVIYVAPERLETRSFRMMSSVMPISLIAVDEAHCVSQWGQDFRPNYLKIADFIDSLPERPPVGAFTATATQRVREDIVRLLRLRDPYTETTGFDRPNLFFQVLQPKDRAAALRSILREQGTDSGIIYCATRKEVEKIADRLNEEGIRAGRYHAGLSDEERRTSQEDFQYDRVQVMVATNAFGMGIDKSNVRFVIHAQLPKSMEAYYQEAGRAGRDGEPGSCILLYSAADIMLNKYMIEHSEGNPDMSAADQALVRKQDYLRLNQMIDYAKSTVCLRRRILNYFGQQLEHDCGSCSVCTGGRYAAFAELDERRGRRKEKGYVYSQTPYLPMKPEQPAPKPRKEEPAEDSLFERLRAYRAAEAAKLHVPAYIVCSDKTLEDMVRISPMDRNTMLRVSGMGVSKVGKFGDGFIEVIRGWRNGDGAPAAPVKKTARASSKAKKEQQEPSTLEALRRGYLSGVSIAQLAAMLAMSEEDVLRKLRQLHLISDVADIPPDETEEKPAEETKKPLQPEADDRPWLPEEEESLRTAYLEGKSIRQLSELHGRSIRSIRTRLIRMALLV